MLDLQAGALGLRPAAEAAVMPGQPPEPLPLAEVLRQMREHVARGWLADPFTVGSWLRALQALAPLQ